MSANGHIQLIGDIKARQKKQLEKMEKIPFERIIRPLKFKIRATPTKE